MSKSLIIYFSRAVENDAVSHIEKGNTVIIAEYVPEGTAGQYRIPMGDISYLLPAGHRLRIDIAGSSFPYADANLGTKEPPGRGKTVRTALLHILHDAEHPSFVKLPVIH